MSKATSTEAYERTLANRFGDFKNALEAIIGTFNFPTNAPERANAIRALKSASDNLVVILDTQDRPGWLQEISQRINAGWQSMGDQEWRGLLEAILKYTTTIRRFQFDFSSATQINF